MICVFYFGIKKALRPHKTGTKGKTSAVPPEFGKSCRTPSACNGAAPPEINRLLRDEPNVIYAGRFQPVATPLFSKNADTIFPIKAFIINVFIPQT